MVSVGEVMHGVELLGQAGQFIWEHTRTTLDINIENKHPHLMLRRFTRHCSVGECTQTPAFDVRPMASTVAKFRTHASRTKCNGCMIYRINVANGPHPNTKDLYVLLAWKINVGGKAHFLLDLVENQKNVFNWNEEQLKKYYRNFVREQLRSAGNSISRTWSLDNNDKMSFTISASMTSTRLGTMDVTIEHGKHGDKIPPHHVVNERFGFAKWDGEDNEPQSANSKRSFLGSSLAVMLENETDEIELRNGEPKIFEGKQCTEVLPIVAPRSNTIIKLKSDKIMFARTSGCIIYELVRAENQNTPLLWGRRVFLAVDVLIIPHDPQERKAAITLLTVKDNVFPHSTNSIADAHEEVLEHCMVSVGCPAQWRMNELNLRMRMAFHLAPHAKLRIKLEQIHRADSRDMPPFLSTDEYSVPSRDAANAIKDYFGSKVPAERGYVLVDNNCKGMTIESVWNTYESKNMLLEEGCDNDLVVPNGHSLHKYSPWATDEHLPPATDAYHQQLYKITSEKNARVSRHRCLLIVSRSYNDYVTAVVHTRRDNREGEELFRATTYFLKRAGFFKETADILPEKVHENTYVTKQLMERDIALPCNSNAHLMVYESSKPPQVFAISLQEPFNPMSFHAKTSPNVQVPKSARPYHLDVKLVNRLTSTTLTYVDFMSTDTLTVDGMPAGSNVVPANATVQYSATYPWQDQRHALLLRFKQSGTVPTYIDVHIDLATDGPRPIQTTAVRYIATANGPVVDANVKLHHFQHVTKHRAALDNGEDEDAMDYDDEEGDDKDSMHMTRTLAADGANSQPAMRVQHLPLQPEERRFSMVLTIADTMEAAGEAIPVENVPNVEVTTVKAGEQSSMPSVPASNALMSLVA
ncbi:hypothetical protein SYNPS1DRAFT_27077 [Syncephalis pseudoplumigaleata]|uniref:Uncharacterized protein n=1 Tax=Syncephalis pseudoplumigaleata TaxID=1712513 RepID=A0A4P9Z614_9FUNG|nr:hypothetical protein SYNPS1DRAFT_27077 [Syncephalis pseudoplumigaleata]|eukprot:RKP27261.1 hypothetical protein SYNPS1DRAFT_27077 [Syncephalis pseudoplumigaleata]